MDNTNIVIANVELQQINVGDEKKDKNDKQYWNPGIKAQGKWYNSFMRVKEIQAVKKWEEGDMVTLCFFEEEYNGKMYKKFRIPTRTDYLEYRIQTLEEELKSMVRG